MTEMDIWKRLASYRIGGVGRQFATKEEEKQKRNSLWNENYQGIIIIFVYGATLKSHNLPQKVIDAKTVINNLLYPNSSVLRLW